MGADVETEFARVLNACFTQSPPVLIRTLDSIHLASARVANETEIVATDRRLREAAALLGFALFPKYESIRTSAASRFACHGRPLGRPQNGRKRSLD